MKLKVNIFGKDYGFFRRPKKDLSEKPTRMVTLASRFCELSNMLDTFIDEGKYVSEQARLALALKIMMNTGIRVGNENSAEGYMTNPHPNLKGRVQPTFVQTFGLTTIKREHVFPSTKTVKLAFLGKRYVDNTFILEGNLAKQVKTFLKKYQGETFLGVTAYELTKFIKTYVGPEYTPKDFRMMKANMHAYDIFTEIKQRELPSSKTAYNKEVKEIATYVSKHLNNTPGVCKKNYIDELLWDELLTLRWNK